MKKLAIIIFFFLTLVSCSYKNPINDLSIIPQPQKVIFNKGELDLLNKNLSFTFDGIDTQILLPLKNDFKRSLNFYGSKVSSFADNSIVIKIKRLSKNLTEKLDLEKKDKQLFNGEGYLLKIEKDTIFISAVSEAGAFYGLQTLKQLLIVYRKKGKLPLVEIIDYPEMKFRALMDDISRGPIPNMDFMKYQVRRLSELKYNYLTYYIEHVVKTKSHPEFAPNDALTIEEIKELSAYAKRFHMTLIGNFQSFGHFENILSHPEYAHLGERGKLLSPAKEESYKFLSDIYSELIPAFDSPMFIVNCDETFDLGKGYSKPMVDSLGYAEVYKMHILRLYEMVKSYGKQMVIWGDVILKYPELLDELPKDIIIGTWDYSAEVNTEELVDPIVNKGYQTIVVPGILNSRRVFPDFNTAFKNINFIKKTKGKPNILGAMLSIWDDGGFAFFNHDWFGVAYCAQTTWNFNDITTKRFDKIYCSSFLQSDNASFTSSIHELNTLGDLIPTYLMNDKILKILNVDEAENSININTTEWKQAYKISKNVRELIKKTNASSNIDEVKALQFIDDLYITLAEEKLELAKIFTENDNKKTKDISDYVASITEDYKKLLKVLDELWLKENRQHFLKNVRALIQARIDNIKLLPKIVEKKNHTVNIFEGKYFTEWLTQNPIHASSITEADKNLFQSLDNENIIHPKVASEFEYNGNIYRWRRIDSQIESVNKVYNAKTPYVEYFYATITSDDEVDAAAVLSSNANAKVYLNDVLIYNDFSKANPVRVKEIENIKLLNKKNTLMIKLFSLQANLEFTFTIKGPRIGGRKNKYMVLK